MRPLRLPSWTATHESGAVYPLRRELLPSSCPSASGSTKRTARCTPSLDLAHSESPPCTGAAPAGATGSNPPRSRPRRVVVGRRCWLTNRLQVSPVPPRVPTHGPSTSRNVKRWQSGEMALRWTAAGILEAERRSGGSSATAISPSSPSRSSATSPARPSRPRPRRPLPSSPPDHQHRDRRREVPRRTGHPPFGSRRQKL